MYFRKSVDIAKAHKALAPNIEDIDSIIYTHGDHPLRPDLLSDQLGIDELLLRRILQLYAAAGTLRKGRRRYCGNCEALIDEEGTPKECDACETKFANLLPQTYEVFAPINPVIAIEVDSDYENARRLRIQFVGGDRGGSTKAQLQTPKELAAIKESLKGSRLSELIDLADAVHAATMEDLCSIYDGQPDLLHFAGHGNQRSLSFIRDQELLADIVPVTAAKLSKILAAFPVPVRLGIFNTCDSAAIAEHLAKEQALAIATGWNGKVPDSVAIAYASQFYQHLAYGLSVGHAFTLASEAATPDGASYSASISAQASIDVNRYFLLGHD